MKIKYILFLSLSILLLTANYAQTSQGEIVISEENIQRLANKLYALKEKLNASKNQSSTFEEEQVQIKALENIIVMNDVKRDTLIYIIEKSLLAEKLNDSKLTEYEVTESNVEENRTDTKMEYVNETSQKVEGEKEKDNNEVKSNSTQIEKNAETKEVLKRLTTIESELKQLKQQESETIVVEREADKDNEDVIIKNRNDKNIPVILAMQIKQNQSLKETNSKLDSLLKVVNAPVNDSLVKSKSTTPNTLSESDNNQTNESLRNQIYLLSAKLDRVLNEQIEAEALRKVEAASNTTDTVYAGDTNKANAIDDAFEARKSKYGNYFEQIFFANNSTDVETKYQDLISNLVQQLENEPKIDVSIAGFASKTGNKNYNQQISMQRALALKKKLMQEGISPQRILTDYRGIDYEASNLAEARRLDIEFVVRK